MCPFCWANVGLVVAGALSTGGLATLVVKVSGKKSGSTEIISNANQRSSQDVS
jgi:hypothetical protein